MSKWKKRRKIFVFLTENMIISMENSESVVKLVHLLGNKKVQGLKKYNQ